MLYHRECSLGAVPTSSEDFQAEPWVWLIAGIRCCSQLKEGASLCCSPGEDAEEWVPRTLRAGRYHEHSRWKMKWRSVWKWNEGRCVVMRRRLFGDCTWVTETEFIWLLGKWSMMKSLLCIGLLFEGSFSSGVLTCINFQDLYSMSFMAYIAA